MTTVRYSKPKARKVHYCNLCFEKINIGERYIYQFNVDCGDSWTFKGHLACNELCDVMKMYDDCYADGVTGDIFHEYIDDSYYKLTNKSYRGVPFPEKLEVVMEHFIPIKK